MQKGTYQVWVNMFANCDPSIATNYTVRVTYKGIAVTPKSGSNPTSGVFPIGTPDNEIDDELIGATKIMEFTINEDRIIKSLLNHNLFNTENRQHHLKMILPTSTWFKSVNALRNPQHCSYAVVTA